MPIDPEKLAIGRAVISRSLGGARLAHSVDSLVASLAEAFNLDRAKPAEAWPDYVAQALAEVDSDLERGAEWRAALQAEQREHGRTAEALEEANRAVAQALADRDANAAELGKARRDILELQRQANRQAGLVAHRKAEAVSKAKAELLADSLILATESDERGRALEGLAEALAAFPLSALWTWPDKMAELVARLGEARRLVLEEPNARRARLAAKLESGK